MQFSLLNFLIGLPQINALANSNAGNGGEQGQKSDALFAELLADPNAAASDFSQGQENTGGDLTQEWVSNITVAQETADIAYEEDSYLANIQGVLNRKISPERARDLLEQFNANTNGERPPEALKEILEAVEAGSEPVSVQDILGQVANNTETDNAAPEQRTGALQRALQWLQQALTPNAAPMEALAFANAAAMFPQNATAQNPHARIGKEKDTETETAIVMPAWVRHIGEQKLPSEKTVASTESIIPDNNTTVVFVPLAQNHVAPLPEVELPSIQLETAAPITDEVIVDDALVLVATKHNSAAQTPATSSSDVFDKLVAELPTENLSEASVSDTPVQSETSADTAIATNTTHTQSTNTDNRAPENVRIHHANFAYLRSEVMDQVKVGVTHAVRDGVDRITIQLNPAELGRVEVKMDIVADGMSHVSFLVEKQETFDLLQRDARTLERMLQDAGVRADAGSMEFNLRQESQSKEPWGEANGKTADSDTEISTLSTHELPTSTYVHLVSDRIDIRA